MYNKLPQEVTKEAVKEKFKGKTALKSRRTPGYPSSAERELQRIQTTFVKMLREELKKVLPNILKKYQVNIRLDSRMDGYGDFERELNQVLDKISRTLMKKTESANIELLVANAAKSAKKMSVREWKKVVKDTLGIDLFEDYYNSEFYSVITERWIRENVSQIKTIHQKALNELRKTVLDAFCEGKTSKQLQSDIQKKYKVTKQQASLIARDQLGTLNSEISKLQQQDAGCKEYIWSDSGDSRVRDCHKALNGKMFSWDDPPEMWYKTKSKGVIYTGRKCHPGEDFCCRCVAIPVFDKTTVNLPMSGGMLK